jgi:hypothetical protein
LKAKKLMPERFHKCLNLSKGELLNDPRSHLFEL